MTSPAAKLLARWEMINQAVLSKDLNAATTIATVVYDVTVTPRDVVIKAL